MNLAELTAEVVAEIARPDLAARCTSAVKAATLAAHGIDVFEQDCVAVPVVFAEAKSTQAIAARDLFPEFREVRSIQIMTLTGQVVGTEIPRADSGDVTDEYAYMKVPVWFRLGDTITIRNATPIEAVRFNYRKFPNITDDGYSSWIAQDCPYYIIKKAVQHMYGSVMGKAEEARMTEAEAREHLPQILNHIVRN